MAAPQQPRVLSLPRVRRGSAAAAVPSRAVPCPAVLCCSPPPTSSASTALSRAQQPPPPIAWALPKLCTSGPSGFRHPLPWPHHGSSRAAPFLPRRGLWWPCLGCGGQPGEESPSPRAGRGGRHRRSPAESRGAARPRGTRPARPRGRAASAGAAAEAARQWVSSRGRWPRRGARGCRERVSTDLSSAGRKEGRKRGRLEVHWRFLRRAGRARASRDAALRPPLAAGRLRGPAGGCRERGRAPGAGLQPPAAPRPLLRGQPEPPARGHGPCTTFGAGQGFKNKCL